MDAVALDDLRLLLTLTAVDEDVDVLPDPATLVEHSARDRRMLSLERPQHVAHRGALDVVLAPPAELGERCAEPYTSHRGHPKTSISTL